MNRRWHGDRPTSAVLALALDDQIAREGASKNAMRCHPSWGRARGRRTHDPEDNERFSVLARDEPPLLDEPPLRGFGGAFFFAAVFFFFWAAQGSQPPPMESSESPP